MQSELTVDALAQEIRRVDGNHSLGAGALAEVLMPFITAALSGNQAVEVKDDLDARMKAAGMYTIAEMMGVTPLTKWKSNPAIKTLDTFSAWLDRKVSEYLTMKAGYDLGDKSTDDELYEWVEAHAAVFGTVRDQFEVVRSALVDVPAVEPVALIEREVLAELAKHKTATGTVCSPLMKLPFGDKIRLYAAPLYHSGEDGIAASATTAKGAVE